jgi:hypothetical protein
VREKLELKSLLAQAGEDAGRRLTLFALVTLGVVESLANGSIGATDAVRFFFNADNCLFVRKAFKEKTADVIMGRGVQLPDLFDCLEIEEARREFLHELSTMRSLCLQLVDGARLVA